MNAMCRQLLTDLRAYFDGELAGELENNSSPHLHSRGRAAMRDDVDDLGALETIARLESFIERIDEVLADNRGAGI